MKNKQTGNKGESLAANYLETLGFNIIIKNWRYKHLEIDIIASKNNRLHIIEVKTRTNTKYGQPEQSISHAKMQHLKNAASAYLNENPQWTTIQFDVVAILLSKPKNDILLIEDVYF